MAEKLAKNSQLKAATLYNVDSVVFWEVPEWPTIELQDDDITHTVTDGDTVDLLAFDYYGDPELWWVIMVANQLYSVTELTTGDVITIPSPRYVNSELVAFGRRG